MADLKEDAKEQRGIARREFVGALAATTAAITLVPGCVLGRAGQTPPSGKLNIGAIGFGGMGASNLHNVETENIVALCDVDEVYVAKICAKYPGATRYTDYREMLAKEKDLDAVIIATPDHTHAVITMAAIRAGKHVYCQKPLTQDVYEARMVAKAAREAGVITQMGIQGHSGEGVRLLCEWIWDGAIGEVREVDAWCSDSYYPPGGKRWSSATIDRPKDTPPVPDTLDWDLWLGPAPYRPYHPCYHPKAWRSWRDFGSGWMADRGTHTFDPVFQALKLEHPTSIEATSLGANAERHPVAGVVTFQFPARGSMPPVKLTWYDGVRAPRPEELEDGRRMGDGSGGVVFKGSEGKLICGIYGDSPRLIPESAMQAYERPEETIPRVEGGKSGHEQEWVRACKAGVQPGANFDFSGPLSEVVQLGNIAIASDQRLEWDPKSMTITNSEQANKMIRPPYREGWSL